MNNIKCSFCHEDEENVEKIFVGSDGIYVCDNCIELLHEMLNLSREEEKISDFDDRSKML